MLGNHLSNEDFFFQLSRLLDSRREEEHGSIFLTQKRLTTATPAPSQQQRADTLADLHPSNPLPILIRATNGKSKDGRSGKIKLSTIVEPDALEAFFSRYAEVCKAGMGALKKRDRSGRKKAKAKKRKAGVEGEKKG